MQKVWQARTLGESRPTSRARRGGLGPADCAGMGFGAIRAGGFLSVEAAAGYKTVASAYSRPQSLHPV